MSEYLYVCHFSNGHIKVGRSISPKSRYRQAGRNAADSATTSRIHSSRADCVVGGFSI